MKQKFGNSITYTIKVKNISDIETEINLNDPLPEYVKFDEETPIKLNDNMTTDVKHNEGVITYKTNLAGNSEITIIFNVIVQENAVVGNDIVNTVYVTEEYGGSYSDEVETEVIKHVNVEKISETVNLMDLVLVLDCSNSMQALMGDLKTAAKGVVDHVFSTSTDSTISLITYGDTATNHGTFEVGNKKSLTDTINTLSISGNTNIYQALEKTNAEISNISNGRKRVVLFLSDGAPTFYDNNENMSEVQIIKESGCTNVPLSWNKQYFPTNTRQNILNEITKLKNKQNITIYSVGLGVDDLSETKIQYVEKEDTSKEQSEYKEGQYKIVNGVKYLYMTEKEYATYVLNNISSLGKYIETDNLNSTFEKIIIEQKKTSATIKLTSKEEVANIPETKEIIGKVTVTVGTNSTQYSLANLEKGVNGLVYTQGSGFKWTIANNSALLGNKLGLSYKVKGAKGN